MKTLAAVALLFLVVETAKGQNIDFGKCSDSAVYCHRKPADCTPASCLYGVTVETDGTQATITLATSEGGMIALGFSDDQSMGEDDVAGCYRKSDDSVIFVDSWNPNGVNPNKLDTIDNLDMGKSMGSYSNGLLQCQIVRDLTTNDTDEDRDWTQAWFLLHPYASTTGPGPVGSLPYHSATPEISSTRVNISAGQVPTQKPTSAVPPSRLVNIDFDDCDDKFCYQNPSDCTPATCLYGLTIETTSTEATIKLTTTADGMIALGFSADVNMGEDDVVGCVRTGGSNVVAKDAWNPNGRNPNVKDTVDNLDTSNSFGTFVDGTLQCQIVRTLISTDTAQDYNWNVPWYLFYPYSTSTGSDGGGFPRHSLTPVTTASKVNITTDRSAGSATSDRIKFVKAHGIFMILAWIGLASTGMILARYYKKVFPNDQPLFCFSGMPAAWFQLHRIHMITTVLFSIIGFIVIFAGVKGWTAAGGDGLRTAHPIIGVIVVALAIAQPIMAAFRCAPDDENRVIFNWAHFLVGTTALILGIVNVYLGIYVADAQFGGFLDRIPVYIVIAWTVIAFIIEMILEIKGYMAKSASDSNEIEMKGKGDQSEKTSEPENKTSEKVLLVVYMTVSLGLAIAMVIVVGVRNP
ncbi:ferric-chelate reductase 1-like isoform X1 [Oscarella lobularis]|uniref:ferric-chelate reductase 1-like isoform X1 n=1 Tax=Oscarella lobularis TaxID=121494 RepID=UPI003313A0D8